MKLYIIAPIFIINFPSLVPRSLVEVEILRFSFSSDFKRRHDKRVTCL